MHSHSYYWPPLPSRWWTACRIKIDSQWNKYLQDNLKYHSFWWFILVLLNLMKFQGSNVAFIFNPHIFKVIGWCSDKSFSYTIFFLIHNFILFNIHIFTLLYITWWQSKDKWYINTKTHKTIQIHKNTKIILWYMAQQSQFL